MLALASRRRCAALTLWLPVTTWKPPSRHSCHTGDSSTVPSCRYVASTASNRRSTRSPRSSMVRFLRIQERYRPASRLLRAHDRGAGTRECDERRSGASDSHPGRTRLVGGGVRCSVVRGEDVAAEIAARPPEHRVRVIAVVGGVVVLDEEVLALHSVVVPCPRRLGALPGEVQLAARDLGGLFGRELGGQPVEIQGDESV